MTNNPDPVKDAIAQLHDAILPAAQLQAQTSGRTILSCMTTMVRAMLRSHMQPPKMDRGRDIRMRDWKVKIYFWDITYGFEGGVLLGENSGSGDTITGLQAVVPFVKQYASDMHPGEQLDVFGGGPLRQRFGGLYSAISKGSGKASTRLHYKIDDKKLMCQVDISRI